MAVLTINGYNVPPPTVDSYEVTTERESEMYKNTDGVSIGEFQRTRARIRWSYQRLTAARNLAICSAMLTGTPGTTMQAVPVTYWDPDSDTFKTGNFIGYKTSPKLNRFAPTAKYTDVSFELVEQ